MEAWALAALTDPRKVAALCALVGATAAVIAAARPWLRPDPLKRRIKAVVVERERIRAREGERLATAEKRSTLRAKPGGLVKQLVESLDLQRRLGVETAKAQLATAGYRGAGAEYAFLAFRLVAPIGLFLVAVVTAFFVLRWNEPFIVKLGGAIAAAYLGMKAPELFLRSKIVKRKKALERAYPDALDLLLIFIEAGMPIELAARKVSGEIAAESIVMAEEMGLLAAEMSCLAERRTAFENPAVGAGFEPLRSLKTVLARSERYSAPLGAALRALAQESRDLRMTAAEKKAAALPWTLAAPMILFFLPALFAAILSPAAIQINHWN
jgi:tight adherence protein C